MLTKKQLDDIKKLQQICEAEDSLKLKLNWDMLESRDKHESDFFIYKEGKLIAFLGMYSFGNKIELCGMVDPKFRRQGMFSELFSRAIHICLNRNYKEILLNAPANSSTAKKFLKGVQCSYSMTEYQMRWNPMSLIEDDDLTIRPSKTAEDFANEVELDVQCFGFLKEEALEYNKRLKGESSQSFYLIENQSQTVGKVRITYDGNEAWIYGFAIFPEYQGQGYGRKALTKVVKNELERGYEIYLDVESENKHALKLYESCGFQTVQAQDYYEYIG